jgi:NAD(P)H-hydrate epimerase
VKLYTAQEMSRADAGAQDLGIPGGVLMERAGVAMASIALERYSPGRALVVCGGGNNGGDGFVIARELHRSGVDVAVVASKEEYEGDSATNLEILKNLEVRLIAAEDLDAELGRADLVVDALLGTGFSGEVREREAGIIEKMNSAQCPVLAVDVPSGVNGTTGEVQGVAVFADLTVCAHAMKVGCVISPGCEHAGEILAVDIGIPHSADVDPSLVWTDAATLRGKIPRTAEPAHKYSAGALLVVAGSRGTTGAPVMVVKGAQRTGCGIVFLATSQGAAPAVDLALTEALVYGVAEDERGYMESGALEEILEHSGRASALVMGPGTGTGEEGRRLVEGILREVELPVLLDADAITNLSGKDVLARRDSPTVITPHAGELGRLLGSGAREVSARRLDSARNAAQQHR